MGAGRRLLVALDIDGTIVTYDDEMSAEVKQAVADVVAAGHELVLATGRSVVGTVPIAQRLGLSTGWAVSSNGAVISRLDPDQPQGYEISDVTTFDPGPALRALRTELPDALYAVEDLGRGFRMSSAFPDDELQGEHRVVPFEELTEVPATRVVVRSFGHTTEDFHEIVTRLGLHEVTYAIGWTAWLDLTPAGVSKASALDLLRQREEIPEDATVAVGDGHNDVEMLGWAARGVAMGQADEVTKAAASEVTGTIADDGLVPVLRSLVG